MHVAKKGEDNEYLDADWRRRARMLRAQFLARTRQLAAVAEAYTTLHPSHHRVGLSADRKFSIIQISFSLFPDVNTNRRPSG